MIFAKIIRVFSFPKWRKYSQKKKTILGNFGHKALFFSETTHLIDYRRLMKRGFRRVEIRFLSIRIIYYSGIFIINSTRIKLVLEKFYSTY